MTICKIQSGIGIIILIVQWYSTGRARFKFRPFQYPSLTPMKFYEAEYFSNDNITLIINKTLIWVGKICGLLQILKLCNTNNNNVIVTIIRINHIINMIDPDNGWVE